jgi:hypothetical protein
VNRDGSHRQLTRDRRLPNPWKAAQDDQHSASVCELPLVPFPSIWSRSPSK